MFRNMLEVKKRKDGKSGREIEIFYRGYGVGSN